MCQRINNKTEIPVEKLKLSKVLERLWTHLYYTLMLQLKVLRVGQSDKNLRLGFNIRELNRELCTELSILYIQTLWSILPLL